MTYEQALKRLEEITSILSNGGVSLEESLAIFSEAAVLADFCHKILDDAQLKIETLLPNEK